MLRHACGYALANAGHGTRRIQDWLGHRSIDNTARYTQRRRRHYCCAPPESRRSEFTSMLVVPQIPETSDKPAMVAYRDALKATLHANAFPPGRPSHYDCAAYAAAKLTEAAMRKVGHNLTREAFVDTLEGTKNFETNLAFPISFSKTNHEGTTQIEIIRVGSDIKWHEIAAGGRGK